MENKLDLRIVKTHKALCDTFLQMLNEKKFETITVNELCERAMVRRATFYKHFADKYDFFEFFVRDLQNSFISQQYKYDKSNSPYAYYIFVFKECVNFFKCHEKLVDGILNSNMLPTLVDIFSEAIYRDILLKLKDDIRNNGFIHFPTSPEILASFYTGGIVQTLCYWFINKDTISENDLVNGIESILRCFKTNCDLGGKNEK